MAMVHIPLFEVLEHSAQLSIWTSALHFHAAARCRIVISHERSRGQSVPHVYHASSRYLSIVYIACQSKEPTQECDVS